MGIEWLAGKDHKKEAIKSLEQKQSETLNAVGTMAAMLLEMDYQQMLKDNGLTDLNEKGI